MKMLRAIALMLTLSACAPPATMEVSWGPGPWYNYCTWDAPCWYSDTQVFVYGWGYLPRTTYVTLYANPGRREHWEHRRREWHPDNRPAYRGQDWDGHKENNGRNHKDHGRDHQHHDQDQHDNGKHDS